jgi:hypothetical protein
LNPYGCDPNELLEIALMDAKVLLPKKLTKRKIKILVSLEIFM